ncbi:MAG: sugar transferase [Candidatus Hydrogenedentota bacterium]
MTVNAGSTPQDKHTASASASSAGGRERFDPSTWAVGWGRARKRNVLITVQVLLAAGVSGGAVLMAYLMDQGWPASMGAIDRSFGNLPTLLWRTLRSPEFAPYVPLVLVSPVIHLLLFQWLGLFRPNLGDTRPFACTSTVLKGAFLGTAVLLLLSYAYGGGATGEALTFSPLFFIYFVSLVFLGVLLGHSATLIALLGLHALGIGRTRTAIVDGGVQPSGLEEALNSPSSEYEFVGHVAARDDAGKDGGAWLGVLEELPALINRHNLDEIILACDPGMLTSKQRLDLAQTCWRMSADLKMVTPFHPFFRTSAQPEVVGSFPLLHVQNLGLYATKAQLMKRALDIAISASALTVLSPVMAAVALAIKLDSKGPVFFIQERVGLNGRTFRMFKFRSMRTDATEDLHKEYLQQLIQANGALPDGEEGEGLYKIQRDPRVTRVGRLIRPTSLDELPQLFNVLRGEMSLVGPRPPIQYEVDEYQQWHQRRLHIRPGLTGLWQVSGRNRLSFDQMVQLDIAYIEQWSLWLDLRILFTTIPVVLRIDQTS